MGKGGGGVRLMIGPPSARLCRRGRWLPYVSLNGKELPKPGNFSGPGGIFSACTSSPRDRSRSQWRRKRHVDRFVSFSWAADIAVSFFVGFVTFGSFVSSLAIVCEFER